MVHQSLVRFNKKLKELNEQITGTSVAFTYVIESQIRYIYDMLIFVAKDYIYIKVLPWIRQRQPALRER